MKPIKPRAAYHEAGHAVVARLLGVGIGHAVMLPSGDSAAGVMYYGSASRAGHDPAAFVRGCEVDAQIVMAGGIAEQIYKPIKTRLAAEHRRNGAWERDAWQAQASLTGAELVRAGVMTVAEVYGAADAIGNDELPLSPQLVAARDVSAGRLHEATWRLLEDNWPAVERVAAAFMQRPFFNQEEIDAIIGGTQP